MRPRCAGFTLIELMIVIALIALASSLVSLALRNPADTQLEQEGARLAALLESARAEARASGLAVQWVPGSADNDRTRTTAGFRFVGLPASAGLPQHWLSAGVTATVIGAPAVVLGPEPMIGPQRIALSLEDRRLTLATDGLGPFIVTGDETAVSR
ncbi:MAG: prepilin-type N-terminal cleavage/methylation domain-containing protein [Burkholderiaceae bacterium]|nr:prepilin-type N-terminal cleavage/methylation domain-containing protein [Burkholderiaceae bacterium]